jgi:hypothetical protein
MKERYSAKRFFADLTVSDLPKKVSHHPTLTPNTSQQCLSMQWFVCPSFEGKGDKPASSA